MAVQAVVRARRHEQAVVGRETNKKRYPKKKSVKPGKLMGKTQGRESDRSDSPGLPVKHQSDRDQWDFMISQILKKIASRLFFEN